MEEKVVCSFRIDKDLKEQAQAICDDIGITLTAAVNMFCRALVNERALPFIVRTQDSTFSYPPVSRQDKDEQ